MTIVMRVVMLSLALLILVTSVYAKTDPLENAETATASEIYEIAVDQYRLLAEQGDAEAQYSTHRAIDSLLPALYEASSKTKRPLSPKQLNLPLNRTNKISMLNMMITDRRGIDAFELIIRAKGLMIAKFLIN